MTNFTVLGLALGLVAAAPAVAAQPIDGSSPVVRLVRTADLDLASDKGRRTLDRRLTIAIHEACGTASDADLEGTNKVRRCRTETLAEVAVRRDALFAAAERGTGIAIAAIR